MISALLALVSATATIAFRIDDSRIDEASGIAVGLRSSGVVYVQNDSGDRNRFFALNARTGDVAATVTVAGATNVDWEDLAVATDSTGTASVWLADIGDNAGRRDEIRVYRVREPKVRAGDDDRRLQTGRAAVYRLRYPDGAHDAESLAVAPGGDAYVVTKTVSGNSTVYRLPAAPSRSRVQTLRRVGQVGLGLGGLATGAAFSTDGRVLAIRTYGEASLWRLTDTGPAAVAAALRRTPTRIALPSQQQGEGVAVVGDHLLVDSEGVGQPVYSVPLPAAVASAASTPATSTGSPSASAASVTPTPSGSSSRSVDPTPDDGRSGRTTGVGLLILLVFFGAIVLLTRRRNRNF